MTFKFSDLYVGPDVNPINRKARAIPFFNPINVYGRVFFFSWFGFMIAFWAWYTFPPLVRKTTSHLTTYPGFACAFSVLTPGLVLQLTATIKEDLSLTSTQVANSNIVSLCVT
jgi:NNP family nitrate/nitrite transporter-like MFS transporter